MGNINRPKLNAEDIRRLRNRNLSRFFLCKKLKKRRGGDMYPFSWTHIIYKPKHMDASLYFTGDIHFVFFLNPFIIVIVDIFFNRYRKSIE